MSRIGIVVGSTRPRRRGRIVAEWVATQAAQEQPAIGFDIVGLHTPGRRQRQALTAMLGEVAVWSRTLTQVRDGATA